MEKRMKQCICLLSTITIGFLLGIAGSAQTTVKPGNSNFDSVLAKKLGADKYGMKPYIFAVLKTGPKDKGFTGKEREELFGGHFTNIKKLAADGKLAVAGPFGKNDKEFRGLFILNVTTVEEAKKLTDTDPVVKAGVMIVELFPWYGSAALMETNNIHEKIAEIIF